jgi:hypothetical protein
VAGGSTGWPHDRAVALTVAVAVASAALLVLPTVMLVMPWLGRALDNWPL